MDFQFNNKIKDFYSKKSVLITGASGFIGKILLLKLLVSCPNIGKIYVLIRSKNNVASNKRLSSMLNSLPFSFILKDDDPIKDKVIPVEGDITKPRLGFSEADRQMLIDNVSIVFHCAASIRFDAPLKESLDYNVLATKQVIELCQAINDMSCFIHCSTAYSHCQRQEIDEQFYKVSTNASDLLNFSKWLPNQVLDKLSPHLLEGRPNTYTFTKALAEQLVYNECQSFPTAVIRPAIVVNAENEPKPGWIDNVNGPSGISILAALGILRAVNWNYYAKTDFVPVDKVANAMIAVGWATGTQKTCENPKVYNVTSSNVNPITWGELFGYGYLAAIDAPSMRAVRPTIKPPQQTKAHPILNPLKVFFSHWMFAYFLDLIIMICGHKKIMVKITGKMHYALEVMSYFTKRQWIFRSNNLTSLFNKLDKDEKEEFNFDMSAIDWPNFARNAHYGNRQYLLKESDDTIPIARKRMQRIQLAYWLIKMLIMVTFAYFISWLPIYFIVGQDLEECRLYHNYYSMYTTTLIVGGIYIFCNRS